MKRIIERLVQLDRRLRNRFLLDTTAADLVWLGSDDAGWWVPAPLLNSSSVAVCAGAGEDITFDISLVDRGLTVYTVDPTPRAIAHVAAALSSLQQESSGVVKGLNYRDYARSNFHNARFIFRPVGLWSRSEQLKFFAPANPSYVSHSAVNLQHTKEYFLANCNSLRDLMEDMGIKRIDILKLDIEGAEHAVLEQMICDRILPTSILVEFDEGQCVDRFDREKFMATVTMLKKQRYNLVKIERWNFTFVRH